MPSGARIQSMFSGIAKRYDLLNHVLSLGCDLYWWRRMARASRAKPGDLILDVAAGTGDSTLALARAGATVISSDFTLDMLKLGPPKFRHARHGRRVRASIGADAQHLPFQAASFDGLTICYGVRNLEDRPKAFREFHRVLKPGGRLTILEFNQPRWAWLRALYGLYSRFILPRVGAWISGSTQAYEYLPESIRNFPDRGALAAELSQAGFQEIRWNDLTGGITVLHLGRKPLA